MLTVLPCHNQVDVSFKRLMKMNRPELQWAILGCLASAVLGAQMPAFAVALSSVIAVFYEPVRRLPNPKASETAFTSGMQPLPSALTCSYWMLRLTRIELDSVKHIRIRIGPWQCTSANLSSQFNKMEADAAMWSGVFVAIGVGTFIASVVQSGTFGLMGAKLARRVRELTFGALLRQVC